MDNYTLYNKFRFDNIYENEPMDLESILLYQIGDLYCDPKTVMDAHMQRFFEMTFVESGTGYVSTNDVPSRVKSGDIYFSFPGETHKLESDRHDNLRYFYLALDLKPGCALAPIFDFIRTRFASPRNRIVNAPNLFSYIRNILTELTVKQQFSLKLMEAEISLLLIHLYRLARGDADNFVFYKVDTKKDMIHNIVRYIDNMEVYSVGEIARQFSFDRSYLSNLFRSVMGVSMQSYIQQKKFERAKILLINERKSITETAELLHYSSIHNFSRAFKEYVGVSPQKFLYDQSAYRPIEEGK